MEKESLDNKEIHDIDNRLIKLNENFKKYEKKIKLCYETYDKIQKIYNDILNS